MDFLRAFACSERDHASFRTRKRVFVQEPAGRSSSRSWRTENTLWTPSSTRPAPQPAALLHLQHSVSLSIRARLCFNFVRRRGKWAVGWRGRSDPDSCNRTQKILCEETFWVVVVKNTIPLMLRLDAFNWQPYDDCFHGNIYITSVFFSWNIFTLMFEGFIISHSHPKQWKCGVCITMNSSELWVECYKSFNQSFSDLAFNAAFSPGYAAPSGFICFIPFMFLCVWIFVRILWIQMNVK